ncbi:MAG: hypothetical protein KGN76_11560 [Acidobacteriota bacterium]|nr:hypothetical protein [Acidobacteriota bacterium]
MPTALRAACAIGALALLLQPAGAAARYTLVVLSHADRSVYELDPDSGRILHRVQLPADPRDAAISPDGNQIYVSLPAAGTIQTIDARSFTLAGRIDSRAFAARPAPAGLALTSDGTTLYAGAGDGLVEVDLASHLTRRWERGLLPDGLFQIQPGSDWLYFPTGNTNRVIVFDTSTHRRTAVLRVNGDPADVGFAPNGDVWFSEDRDGTATVASSMTHRVQQVVRTGGRGASRIAVSPDGRYVAVTHAASQDVALIDARARRLLGVVATGRGPGFPVFSADSARLFVMNRGAGDVAVVDVSRRTVVARWKAGTDPFGGGLRYLAHPQPPAAVAGGAPARRPGHPLH